MTPMHRRFFRAEGEHRFAVISCEPAASEEGLLVRVALGADRQHLDQTKVYGPLSETEAQALVEEMSQALTLDGFGPPGAAGMFTDVKSPKAGVRARAALHAVVVSDFTYKPRDLSKPCGVTPRMLSYACFITCAFVTRG